MEKADGEKEVKVKHRHKKHKIRREKRDIGFYLKWFLFWFLIYGVLIWIFELLNSKYTFITRNVGYYFLLSLFLILISRIIYSAIKKKSFSFRVITPWTIVYASVLFIINFLLDESKLINNYYLDLVVTSAIFTAVAMFLRRMKIKVRLFGKKPSQILTGVILIIFGILCWRFSSLVFIDWFGWVEGLVWSWLIGLALIVAGFLTLVAWWRNNVSMFTTKHKIKWN